jgi:hypothetical protein
MRRVFLRLRMRPHVVVHRGNEEHGTRGGKQTCGEQVSRLARRGSRHEVGGGGCNDDRVGFARELDVVECTSGIEQAVCTGRPVSASKVTAPTNSWAAGVITTSTCAPALLNSRASHAAL